MSGPRDLSYVITLRVGDEEDEERAPKRAPFFLFLKVQKVQSHFGPESDRCENQLREVTGCVLVGEQHL